MEANLDFILIIKPYHQNRWSRQYVLFSFLWQKAISPFPLKLISYHIKMISSHQAKKKKIVLRVEQNKPEDYVI